MNIKRLIAGIPPIVILLGPTFAPLALGQDDWGSDDEEEMETSDESSDGAQSSDVEESAKVADSEVPAANPGNDKDVTGEAAGSDAKDKQVDWNPNDSRNDVNPDLGVGRPVSREDNEAG